MLVVWPVSHLRQLSQIFSAQRAVAQSVKQTLSVYTRACVCV